MASSIKQPGRGPDGLDDYGYPGRPDARRRLRKAGMRTSKRILNACIFLCMALLGGLLRLRRRGRRDAPPPLQFAPMRRILVIRLDLIGDLVLSTVVARALKRTFPEAQIDLLALPSSAKIVQGDPELAEIITYDPNVWRRPKALLKPGNWREARRLIHRLRGRRYDLAVSVFGKWAAVLAVLSGARRTVGFEGEGYPGFMTDGVPGRHWRPGERLHEVDYCLQLAQAAGAAPAPEDRIPRLYVPAKAKQEIDALLEQAGIQPGKFLVAFHVASNNGQSKRWPIPYWAALLDRLTGEEHAQVVLTGAPVDLPLIERVTRRMNATTAGQVVNLAGKTSLGQLAALLQRADLLITGDSGPMHIAAAVGTALIAIHGPTDPAHSGPVSARATILKSDIWCRPCYNARDTADCRFFTTQCMKDITSDQVYEIARQKLAERAQHFVKREAQE
jgi:lipopolysaccharide heptosyltransferase II